MSKNEDMVELTSLAKVGKDKWQFQVKSHGSFESIFEALLKGHVFNVSTVESVYTPSLKETSYFINDQGIWLLSHCFSNWTEMYAKATKKSPWEENWQKRAERGGELEHCCLCGEALHTDYTHCGTCNKPLCSFCDEEHQRTHKDYCAGCSKLWYRDVLENCKECGKKYCVLCMFEHKKTHQQKQKTVRFCSGCNTAYPDESVWYCEHCGWYYCRAKCMLNHMVTCPGQSYTYTNRREYGIPNFEYVNADFMRYYQLYKNGIWSEAQFKEYFSGQAKAEEERIRRQKEANAQAKQAREEEARKQREKANQEEFFKNFWNADQRFYHPPWEEDFSDTFKSHFRGAGQQSQSSNFNYHGTQTRSGVSSDILAAFQTLGLPPAATVQEIKRAFRREAKKAHPDTGGSDQAFKKLNEAYQLALAYAERNEVK